MTVGQRAGLKEITIESHVRSAGKILFGGGLSALPYIPDLIHSAGSRETVAVGWHAATEAATKTVAFYFFERWFAGLQFGRSASADKPAEDSMARSALKCALWCAGLTPFELGFGFAATHDWHQAWAATVMRNISRVASVYFTERICTKVQWGVTRVLVEPEAPKRQIGRHKNSKNFAAQTTRLNFSSDIR